ncbi:MAG TPA: NAD(P)-binding protein, partial [Actinomycetota bacterium]|nr:NAD(P)-binding protein [Actinomycetota bacterium]
MTLERADVLIIGAGASGGVVGLRLAQAGFKVVCLEQGRWHDRAEFPGPKPDWELRMRKQWSPDPNVRRNPEDYPVNDRDSDIT